MSVSSWGVSLVATVTPAEPPGGSSRTVAPSSRRLLTAALHTHSRCCAVPSGSPDGSTEVTIANAASMRSGSSWERESATRSPDCRRPVRRSPSTDATRARQGADWETPDLVIEHVFDYIGLMGWSNPPVPWREIERRLSDRVPGIEDAPVSRRKRPLAEPLEIIRPESVTPYAELHCHSHFSFLDGASSPTDLVVEGSRLGLSALALTDHDNFAGAPLFAEASTAYGLPSIFGAELSLGLSAPQNGIPDPEGSHLLVLARGVEGYHRLAAAMTDAHLRGDEKGRPSYHLEELSDRGRGHWVVLTGCRKGAVQQ